MFGVPNGRVLSNLLLTGTFRHVPSVQVCATYAYVKMSFYIVIAMEPEEKAALYLKAEIVTLMQSG